MNKVSLKISPNIYYAQLSSSRSINLYQETLLRCIESVKLSIATIGLRNPKIGKKDHSWEYCDPFDWVMSFRTGQLWLAASLTGEQTFIINASARNKDFRKILENPLEFDHDLGFQFSLSCVANWKITGNKEARSLALRAAEALSHRFNQAGNYIQAWNPKVNDPERSRFVTGRIIADTMQNIALLYWAHFESGISAFKEIADAHAQTSMKYLIREDGTSYHTFMFDPATGVPVRGETHQGYADESCWARGHAWMIHGFAQSYLYTKNQEYLKTAILLANTAEKLMGDDLVPVWDYKLSKDEIPYKDSSAGAIMAAGLYILASVSTDDAPRFTAFADRLLNGLIETCDLTKDPKALGLLAHGASHVGAGYADNMLPYGDYYFMEALMRSLGHNHFFW
ncbi:glycosyl hydrolase [Gammaproteobacteria bacterium]|nr:glycosyl hydrolase [Gammaproteobacteria bacterium]